MWGRMEDGNHALRDECPCRRSEGQWGPRTETGLEGFPGTQVHRLEQAGEDDENRQQDAVSWAKGTQGRFREEAEVCSSGRQPGGLNVEAPALDASNAAGGPLQAMLPGQVAELMSLERKRGRPRLQAIPPGKARKKQ